jgi:predicted site-specific integrase-resolvase
MLTKRKQCDPESQSGYDIIYARVSTRGQRDHLETQTKALIDQYGSRCIVITDIGSGLNFSRPGLKQILSRVLEGGVRTVYCAHKDRLCRFAFDLLEFIFHKNGTKIEVADDDNTKTNESQLADDIISILTVFGARVYGARSGKRKKASKVIREAENETRDGDGGKG